MTLISPRPAGRPADPVLKATRRDDPETVLRIAGRFRTGGPGTAAIELRAGHINDSFVVSSAAGSRFLLQRINGHVFPNPGQVMANIVRITRHLEHRLGPASARRRLTLVPTVDGEMWRETATEGGSADWWRMYELIEDTTTELRASTPEQAFLAAQAFGRFETQLVDLPSPPLHETIPGFHDTLNRFEAFDRALAAARASAAGNDRRRQAIAEIRSVAVHRDLAARLSAAAHDLPRRTVHNDCKISNILFDRTTGEALCVVDLDTTMPGLAAYDFGDMVRSMSHRADEDARETSGARVDPELFTALAQGYLDGSGFLTAAERRSLVDGALVLTLEQAVRFLTDHLDGDVYFRVERPGQNLDRCRVQLALLESLLARDGDLRRIVEGATT
ncbi:MAG: aminoglycoside phosphotransferase family protein [Holophagales bacterium]|nr:aminoglycoside phosphotransferase family protein [Holophagales bacterium]MYD23627.1 aminoglycoside phosphotransferase family protein [Holophagales bacterium]MYI33875.1 aminoglycoside phosphotransferase family protein [Holophagales bacterium]